MSMTEFAHSTPTVSSLVVRRLVSSACERRIEAGAAARFVGALRADEHALAAATSRCVWLAGSPQTTQMASVLVMYSAIASSCGIGSKGLPR